MKKTAKETSPGQASLLTQLIMPLAALIRGDLLTLVHQLGLQAIAVMLEGERTKLCGERYKHDKSRTASRAGTTRGELALGGRRVTLRRPRVTDSDGNEVALDAWTELSGTDPLDARAGADGDRRSDKEVRALARDAARRHLDAGHEQERGEP